MCITFSTSCRRFTLKEPLLNHQIFFGIPSSINRTYALLEYPYYFAIGLNAEPGARPCHRGHRPWVLLHLRSAKLTCRGRPSRGGRPGAGIETDHTAFGRGVDAQTVKAATPKADYMIKLED